MALNLIIYENKTNFSNLLVNRMTLFLIISENKTTFQIYL